MPNRQQKRRETSHLRRDEPLDDLETKVDNLGVLCLTALHEWVEDLVGQVGGRGLGQARVANLLPNRTSLKLLYFVILSLRYVKNEFRYITENSTLFGIPHNNLLAIK